MIEVTELKHVGRANIFGVILVVCCALVIVSMANAPQEEKGDGSEATIEDVEKVHSSHDQEATAGGSTDEVAGEVEGLTSEDMKRLHREAMSSYGEGKYSEALATYSKILLNDPGDVVALYNSACVQAKLDHPRKAAKLLVVAASSGFIDFERMKNDADLDSIRGEPEYETILEMGDELRDAAGSRLEDLARKLLGAKAIVERDDRFRIIYGANLDRETFERMKADLEQQMTWQVEHLFGGPPNSFVLLLVPTPEKAHALIGTSRVGGFYDHDTKRLVTRDLGPSLEHELTHALHHAQMDRLGQVHPMWIQEGFASVFEMYEIGDDDDAGDANAGSMTVLGNARLNIVINLREIGGLTKWDKFFSLSDKKFVSGRPRARYAEARTIFQFLGEKGLLEEWYRTYVANFAEDSTGRLAFLKVFHVEKLGEVEQKFRVWLGTKEKIPERVPADHGSLGLWVADQGANDGVRITGVHPSGAARQSGIVKGEVIISVDGKPVYSVEEVVFEMMRRESGNEVTLHLRRGLRYHDVTIALRAVGQPRSVEIVQAPGAPV